MGKSQLRNSLRFPDRTTRVADRSLRIGVGSNGSDRVEIGSCILGFGNGACSRIHVSDVIRNAGRPDHLAPLALKGVSGVGTTLLFINDERTDALLERIWAATFWTCGQREKSCAIIAPVFVVALRVTPSSTTPAQVRPFTQRRPLSTMPVRALHPPGSAPTRPPRPSAA